MEEERAKSDGSGARSPSSTGGGAAIRTEEAEESKGRVGGRGLVLERGEESGRGSPSPLGVNWRYGLADLCMRNTSPEKGTHQSKERISGGRGLWVGWQQLERS